MSQITAENGYIIGNGIIPPKPIAGDGQYVIETNVNQYVVVDGFLPYLWVQALQHLFIVEIGLGIFVMGLAGTYIYYHH